MALRLPPPTGSANLVLVTGAQGLAAAEVLGEQVPQASGARPRLGINVAFAGHNRAADLGDRGHVAEGVAAAFGLLADAGVTYATLLTGAADGADLIAAQVWRSRGLGPIHAVHPFLTPQGGKRAKAEGPAHCATWLDGAAMKGSGRNPHLVQTRWLIGTADLLVAVWTGGRGRGAGGTADAVRLALEHNVPVLWVKPGDALPVRLIRPEHLDDDFGFLELVEQLQSSAAPLVCPATGDAIAEVLSPLAEDAPDEAVAERRKGWLDRALGRSLWRTYELFTRVVGGRRKAAAAEPDPPPDLCEQAGFEYLTEAYRAADHEAQRLAAIHRSQQVLLLVAAISAASIGAAPAIWPEFKISAVLVELVLAVVAVAISAGAARSERHERWGRARRLAEQLRLERAAWTLGLSTSGHRLAGAGPSPPEARVARRRAGLPQGAYDADRVARWGAWALSELVGGQARYHRANGVLNHRIAHRIHLFETASFAVFLFALAAYVGSYFASGPMGVALPHWAAGAVVMTSVIVPALGAASIAIEATLAFGEQSRRNLDLAARLERVEASLGPSPGLDQLQAAAKEAIRLQMGQEERWTDESFRRRLMRAG